MNRQRRRVKNYDFDKKGLKMTETIQKLSIESLFTFFITPKCTSVNIIRASAKKIIKSSDKSL